MKVKNSEIIREVHKDLLLDVCWRRQLQVCQNPDLLRRVPVVAGSKEERDGGSLSSGREMPVIADGDGEHKREVCHSLLEG